ncbi:ATP-binding protein [Nostoc sp. NIES-2111]
MSGAISQSGGDNAILFGSIGQVGTINILKLDPTVGAKVTLVPPENQQSPQLRSLPIILNPRPFPLLLGRREEVKIALDALPYDQSVQFFGLAGVGKTALLRYLAHHPSITPAFPDGIIYHRCNQYESVSDLLQVLFNAFYESSIQFKPSDIEIRQALTNKKALIILDGAKLTRAEVQSLITDLPSFTFLFAAGERQLWGEGQPVKLGGLPLNDALALIARELGHPLSQEERADAESLCIALDGHPLKILQAVALVNEEDLSLAAIAQRFQTATNSSWVEKLLSSLKKPQCLILALLAALGANIALAPQRIADLTELPQVQTLLESLLKRNLIEVEGDHLRWGAAHRYRLASSLVEELQKHSDITHWMECSVNYFTNWLQQNGITESLMQESQTILRVVEWAAGVGRWADVITLGKAIEGSLALSGQWCTWDKLLHCLLEAARVTGNQAIEAYTLHQLGTRALCLNEVVPAQNYLSQALRIRESLNDQTGIEVTRHNLQFLTNPPLPPKPQPQPKRADSQSSPDIPVLMKLATAVLLFILGGWGVKSFWPLPTPQQSSISQSKPTETPLVNPTSIKSPETPLVNPTSIKSPETPLVNPTSIKPNETPLVNPTSIKPNETPSDNSNTQRLEELRRLGALPTKSNNPSETTISPKLQSLSIANNEVYRNEFWQGTITISHPAPTQGIPVNITSDDPSLIPQATIVVSAGQTTQQFSLKATKFGGNETCVPVKVVNITASYETIQLQPQRLEVKNLC